MPDRQIDLVALAHGEVFDQRKVDIVDRTTGLRVTTGIGECTETCLDIARVRVLSEVRTILGLPLGSAAPVELKPTTVLAVPTRWGLMIVPIRSAVAIQVGIDAALRSKQLGRLIRVDGSNSQLPARFFNIQLLLPLNHGAS